MVLKENVDHVVIRDKLDKPVQLVPMEVLVKLETSGY